VNQSEPATTAPADADTDTGIDTGIDTEVDAAFAAFYRESVPSLVAFLVMQGATLADAADIAQESMTKAYRDWHRLMHPRAWVHRVASRALIRRLVNDREHPVGEVPEPAPLLRATDIERWEQRHDIVCCLAKLPPLSDYRPAEIAVELDLPPATVRQTLFLARRALAAGLRGSGRR
jgi:RNA polymerase sigma-70 factor (ECF subfamily)